MVHYDNYERAKALGQWPLRTNYATGKRSNGFTINGYVNLSDFIDEQDNQDMDWIQLAIATFDTDINALPNTKGVPEMFKLSYSTDSVFFLHSIFLMKKE